MRGTKLPARGQCRSVLATDHSVGGDNELKVSCGFVDIVASSLSPGKERIAVDDKRCANGEHECDLPREPRHSYRSAFQYAHEHEGNHNSAGCAIPCRTVILRELDIGIEGMNGKVVYQIPDDQEHGD